MDHQQLKNLPLKQKKLQLLFLHQAVIYHGNLSSKMEAVLLAQNSQDPKRMVSVLQTCAPEVNSYMSGDTACLAQMVWYTTNQVEHVKTQVEIFWLA